MCDKEMRNNRNINYLAEWEMVQQWNLSVEVAYEFMSRYHTSIKEARMRSKRPPSNSVLAGYWEDKLMGIESCLRRIKVWSKRPYGTY